MLTFNSQLMVAYSPLRHHKNFFRMAFTFHPIIDEKVVVEILQAIEDCGEQITVDMLHWCNWCLTKLKLLTYWAIDCFRPQRCYEDVNHLIACNWISLYVQNRESQGKTQFKYLFPTKMNYLVFDKSINKKSILISLSSFLSSTKALDLSIHWYIKTIPISLNAISVVDNYVSEDFY